MPWISSIAISSPFAVTCRGRCSKTSSKSSPATCDPKPRKTEQRLGRALTADDQSALLKKHGHPWLVASGYLPQQYLVGPALYPYYRQALVIVLFWVVLPISLGGGALAAIYSPDSTRVWARVLGAAWTGSLYSIGIVTIVFTVLESQRVRITTLDKWDPSWLPEPHEGRAVPRSETLIGLIFTTTFLLWWTDLLRAPQLIDYGGEPVRFIADPIWAAVFLPVLISLLLTVATAFVDLVRPWRTTFFSMLRVAIDAGSGLIAVAVLRAGHWVQVRRRSAACRQARARRLLDQPGHQVVALDHHRHLRVRRAPRDLEHDEGAARVCSSEGRSPDATA